MFYAIYLIGILGYLVKGIGDHFVNFIDGLTGMYILLPCVMVLFSTKSFRAFGRSFLIVFGKEGYSVSQCKESLQSVRSVMLAAVISGVIGFLVGMINRFRLLASEWALADGAIWLLLDTSVAMISLFYAMVICLILLPIPFYLKKCLLDNYANEKVGEKIKE